MTAVRLPRRWVFALTTLALAFVVAIAWAMGFEAGHPEIMTVSPSPVVNGPTTVSLLPSCNASVSGQYYLVTDALLPVLGSLLTGGGSVSVVVKCSGTSWLAI